MPDVDQRVFRAYDIRALVPDLVDETSSYFGKLNSADSFQAPLTPEGVEAIGRGLARFFGAETVVVGYDARLSSPAWAAALARGLNSQGINVIDIGLATTDTVYYASGALDLPGVEITASHCTKELNGMKLVRAGARIVGRGSGMEDLAAVVAADAGDHAGATGHTTRRNILPEYTDRLMEYVRADAVRPFRILADAGNGAAGPLAHALFARLPQLQVTELYFEPDGRFPNHPANPFERENILELIERVPAEKADFGVAWDGDADRVIFLDETGEPVPGDFITTLVARYFLNRIPGATIIYDLRASWAVRDWVNKLGGRPIAERVGHSYIKQTMRAEDGVFGGEVSGHYYFRDHYYADNGFIPLLAVLEILSQGGKPFSALIAELGNYHVSGEINSTVADVPAAIERVKTTYADGKQDFRDGISVEYPDWHFNVRPSANDPLLRLNLEALSRHDMETRRDEVLRLIRQK